MIRHIVGSPLVTDNSADTNVTKGKNFRKYIANLNKH